MRRLAVLPVAVVLLVGCGEAPSPADLGPPPTTSEGTTTVDTGSTPSDPPSVDDGAVVVDVVDGDTVEVELAGGRETVRLVGINAPERGECLADEATRWLRDRLSGREAELVVDDSDRDRYGRLLRYVEIDGADVGAGLVRAGLALARHYPPDTARADTYEGEQRVAEAAAVGMWASDACGAGTSDADVAITELRFDAEGDDNRNLNDEWVRISNRSSSPVDMTGWVLKDTSATHRYRFPDGFVLGSGASVTVRTGCGTATATDLHWCNEGSAVWNNSGDRALLLDPAGNIVDSVDG